MLNERNNFDTLDILAAAIGMVIAFSLLPVPADRGTERIVVCLSILVIVTIKRMWFPPRPANPDSSRLLRMGYLFIAISGTACVALAFVGIFLDVSELRVPTVFILLLGGGTSLLLIAAFLDFRFLKRLRVS